MSDQAPASPAALTTDVTAVVVLSGLALFGLDDSYASRAYLVTGMIGVVAVTAWALLCTVQRYAAGVFLLVASIAFPVLGATAALHNYDWLGFPSIGAVGDLLTAAITAPPQFLTTIPPVDATGTVLAIPYLVGFLLGGTAAWTALRTRRPMLPVVPLVVALAACIALGTEEPRAMAARAVLFASLVVLWVGVRAARLRTVVHAARGRSLRAVTAVVVSVGAVLLASVWLPTVPGNDRVVLRGRIGTGQDVSQLDNPLAGFRKFTAQPPGTADNVAAKRLLRVTGLPRGDLLRFVALDTYDGNEWMAGNRTVVDDNGSLFQRIGLHVAARDPGRRIRVGVEVEGPWTSSWLPLAGQLTGVSFDYLDGQAQREDVRYNVATGTAMVVGGLERKDDYHFMAIVPATALTRSDRPYGTGAAAQPAGAFLDRSLAPWRTSGLSRMRQVFSLARYLRVNGRYSNGRSAAERRYLPGHSQSRLGAHFFGARSIVGDDEQYAAFMALAANRLGVPARVVVGASPGRRGWVEGSNVLAWVEVRIADGTWRVLPTARFMSHKPPRRSDIVQTPESYVRTTTPDEPRQSAPTQAQQPQGPVQVVVQQASHAWQVVVAALLVVLVGAVPFAKWVRRRRRRTTGTGSQRYAGGWAEVLDLVRDAGRVVPPGLPRTEQAVRLVLSLELARAADERVFAPAEPSDEDAREFWRAVAVERRRLRGELPVVRRVWAVWNPGSLLRWLRSRARFRVLRARRA